MISSTRQEKFGREGKAGSLYCFSKLILVVDHRKLLFALICCSQCLGSYCNFSGSHSCFDQFSGYIGISGHFREKIKKILARPWGPVSLCQNANAHTVLCYLWQCLVHECWLSWLWLDRIYGVCHSPTRSPLVLDHVIMENDDPKAAGILLWWIWKIFLKSMTWYNIFKFNEFNFLPQKKGIHGHMCKRQVCK